MSAPIDSLQIGMRRPLARPDGLERMLQTLAAALPGQGVNVRDPQAPVALPAIVPAAPAPSNVVLQTFANAQATLARLLRRSETPTGASEPELKPDVVALHFAPHAAPTLGQFGKVPRVVHFHGSWVDEHRSERGAALLAPLRHGLERMVYRGGTRLIVPSQASSEVLQARYRVAEEHIRVVPGCVDTSRFALPLNRRQVRKRLGIPHDRPVLLCVRPLMPGLGLEELIEAMALVRLAVPEVLLILAGTGPQQEKLYGRIMARGLMETVRIAGFVSDDKLPLFYRAADATIVPTVNMKDCGLTALESIATGTPVLVMDAGGAAAAIAPLSDDLVLPSGDYRALAAGISDALLGDRMMPTGDQCRRYARKHFDHSVVAAQIAGVYRDAIETL